MLWQGKGGGKEQNSASTKMWNCENPTEGEEVRGGVVPDPLGSFLLSEQTTVDLRSDMGKDLPAAVIPLYFPVEILAGRDQPQIGYPTLGKATQILSNLQDSN